MAVAGVLLPLLLLLLLLFVLQLLSLLPLLLSGQVLLEKHSALLEAAQETGRERVVTPFQSAKGLVVCLAMAASALYAMFAAVDQELAYLLGTDRVALIAAQVRLFLLFSLLFCCFGHCCFCPHSYCNW